MTTVAAATSSVTATAVALVIFFLAVFFRLVVIVVVIIIVVHPIKERTAQVEAVHGVEGIIETADKLVVDGFAQIARHKGEQQIRGDNFVAVDVPDDGQAELDVARLDLPRDAVREERFEGVIIQVLDRTGDLISVVVATQGRTNVLGNGIEIFVLDFGAGDHEMQERENVDRHGRALDEFVREALVEVLTPRGYRGGAEHDRREVLVHRSEKKGGGCHL